MLLKDIFNEVINEYNDYQEGDNLFEEYDYSSPEAPSENPIDDEVVMDFEYEDEPIEEGDVLDVPSEESEIEGIETIEIPEDVIFPKPEVEEEPELIIDEEDLVETFDFGASADINLSEEDDEYIPDETVEEPIVEEDPNPQIEDADEVADGILKPSEFTFEQLKEFVDDLTDNERKVITKLMEGTDSDNFVGGSDIPNSIEVDEATAEDLPDSLKSEVNDDKTISNIMNDNVDYHFIGRNVGLDNKEKVIDETKLIGSNLGFVITLPGIYIEKGTHSRKYINLTDDSTQVVVDDSGNEFRLLSLVPTTKNLDATYKIDTTEDGNNVIKLDDGSFDLRDAETGKDYPLNVISNFDDVNESEILGVVLPNETEGGNYMSYSDEKTILKSAKDVLTYYTNKSPVDVFDVYVILGTGSEDKIVDKEPISTAKPKYTKNPDPKKRIAHDKEYYYESDESDLSEDIEAKVIAEAARQLLNKMK